MVSVLALGLLLGTMAGTLPGPARNDFQWKGFVRPGQAIEVMGIHGDVVAMESMGSQVEVYASKHGSIDGKELVRLAAREHAGGVTVCAVYPALGEDGESPCLTGNPPVQVQGSDVQVDFVVMVPAGVRFVGRTVNGRVVAKHLSSDVEAYSVNGGIRVSTTGNAQAKTVNGSIDAELGRTDWLAEREFSTVNGTVTLDLPLNSALELNAESKSGEVISEFPLRGCQIQDGRRLEGRIGIGGRQLRVSTVNGNINLKRSF